MPQISVNNVRMVCIKIIGIVHFVIIQNVLPVKILPRFVYNHVIQDVLLVLHKMYVVLVNKGITMI